MIKQITQLEHVIGDRVYNFACNPQSPINEVREALYKFLGYVDAIEKQIAEQEKQKAAETPPVEAPPEEPKA